MRSYYIISYAITRTQANYNLIGDPGDRLVEAVMTGHLATESKGL